MNSSQSDAHGPLDPDGFSETVQLVRRSKEGDENALNDLLERYQDRVLRVVRIRKGSRLRTSMESVDLVQETLATAAQNLADFEMTEPAGLIRWLAQIAEHRIKNAAQWLGAQKRDPAGVVRLDATGFHDGPEQEPVEGGGPHDEVQQRERDSIVDAAVSGLRPDWREVLVVREYEGGSWGYAADRLQRSVEATQALHQRARQALAAELARRGVD